MFNSLNIAVSEFGEWEHIATQCAYLKDPTYIGELVRSIRLGGFVDPLHGFVPPREFLLQDDNYREGFSAHGSNSRSRALLMHVLEYVLTYGRSSTIYLNEALSPFAQM